jgi:hypothetical protein
MKILFTSKHKNSPVYQLYKSGFEKDTGFLFDEALISEADVILLTGFVEDYIAIKELKLKYPEKQFGIVDPRLNKINSVLNYIDFLIVDSIEMKDYYMRYNKPIHLYYEFFKLSVNRNKKDQEKIILGYHGNKVHLMGMYPKISKALEMISKDYQIEFWALYNIKKLGFWRHGRPNNVKIKDIQWSTDNFKYFLENVDIGIVPALMPVKRNFISRLFHSVSEVHFNESSNDYLTRFKILTNPGRIFTFSVNKIPVIADMFPSAIQFIKDGESGKIAFDTAGWYYAIKDLVLDKNLRDKFADTFYGINQKYFDYEIQNKNLIDFIHNNSQFNNSNLNFEKNDKVINTLEFLFQKHFLFIKNIIYKLIGKIN